MFDSLGRRKKTEQNSFAISFSLDERREIKRFSEDEILANKKKRSKYDNESTKRLLPSEHNNKHITAYEATDNQLELQKANGNFAFVK